MKICEIANKNFGLVSAHKIYVQNVIFVNKKILNLIALCKYFYRIQYANEIKANTNNTKQSAIEIMTIDFAKSDMSDENRLYYIRAKFPQRGI